MEDDRGACALENWVPPILANVTLLGLEVLAFGELRSVYTHMSPCLVRLQVSTCALAVLGEVLCHVVGPGYVPLSHAEARRQAEKTDSDSLPDGAGNQERPIHSASESWCSHCKQIQPKSASHCHTCRRCVFDLDHHCGVLNVCVGRRNYYVFAATLLSGVSAVVLAVLCAVLHSILECRRGGFTLKEVFLSHGLLSLAGCLCAALGMYKSWGDREELFFAPVSENCECDWMGTFFKLGSIITDGTWKGPVLFVAGLALWLPMDLFIVAVLPLFAVYTFFPFVHFHFNNWWQGVSSRTRFKELKAQKVSTMSRDSEWDTTESELQPIHSG